MAEPLLPITFQEHLQLTDFGISSESISFDTVTMESDRYICVRDIAGEQSDVVIIDMNDLTNPKRRPIRADAALMHPFHKVLALKGTMALKIYNLETKSRIKEHTMHEGVKYMRWISFNILALVTENSVYHWSMEGDSTPVKAFDLDPTLHGCRITNYQADPKQEWLLLTGQTSIPNRIVSAMQLYSAKWQCSQPFEGYAGAFATFKLDYNPEPSTLLCFAIRTKQCIRLNITEIGQPPAGNQPFNKRTADIHFPPEAQNDYPVAIQISTKHDIAFVITNYGYIHLYDIGSATCICVNRVSADTIFVTAPNESTGGIIGVNRAGHVLSVNIDENNIVSFIANILQNSELALRIARKNFINSDKNRIKKKSKLRVNPSKNQKNPNELETK